MRLIERFLWQVTVVRWMLAVPIKALTPLKFDSHCQKKWGVFILGKIKIHCDMDRNITVSIFHWYTKTKFNASTLPDVLIIKYMLLQL